MTALSLAALVVCVLFWLMPMGAEPGPEQELRAAWSAASAADSFEFSTELEQTTHPAPSLANVGRSSRTDVLHVSGATDRRTREMRMTLAKDAAAGPGQALEMRVRDGVAEGRVSGGAWQRVDDATNAFAPGGDMLSYIDAAVNVTRTADGFAFDIDAVKLSEQMREQLAQQMTARGELPPGMSVETPAALRGAVGSAQVWLNEAGYPARMSVEMSMPAQANGERSVARFSTRFENYKGGPVTAAFGATLRGRLQELRRQAGSPDGANALGTLALTAALGMAFAAAVDAARRSRRVRTAMIGTIIAVMTGGPLLQTQLVHAANEQVRERTEQQKSAENSRVAADALKASLTANTWAPNLDPLAEPIAAPAAGQRRDPIAPNDEMPFVAERVEAEAAVVDNSDVDGDGLTGTQEARLGTDPTSDDSDGDGLLDRTEVVGWTYAGKTWYLDPMSVDSNNDGVSDAVECLPRVTSATAVCPDSDADGVPDAFDDDNDNDGVPDSVDISPQRVMGANGVMGALAPFSATAPLQLSVNNLQRNPATGKGYPTFVEFQVRPDNAAHLAQESNVFDWPGGDELGQIQRPLTDAVNGLTNTTFATYSPNGDARNANGDLRLTPMLAIRMSGDKLPVPYVTPAAQQQFAGNGITGTLHIAPSGAGGTSSQISFTFAAAGSYSAVLAAGTCLAASPMQTQTVNSGGSIAVPLRATALADGAHALLLSRAGDATKQLCVPLLDMVNGARSDAMVDVDFFTPYGVMLRDVNPTTIEAYVPIMPIIDGRTSDRVAFGARMPYLPDDPTAWGNNHEVRLIWMLTLLQDGGGASIVHIYDDEWRLTGLSVREDRGTDVAIAFEDPASDPDREDHSRLHALANGLGSTFLTARDADGDDVRDVTIATIKSRFDKGTNGAATPVQRWNLEADAFKVATYTYANSDQQIYIAMTETASLLEANFYAAGNVLSSAPLLLFARETRMRSVDLDAAAAATSAQLTMNLDPVDVPQQTFVNVSWAPYQRVGGKWQAYAIEQYGSKLTSDFQKLFENEPESERAINVMLMRSAYLTIVGGMNAVLREEGGRFVVDADAASDAALGQATTDLTDAALRITNFINPQATQLYVMLMGTADDTAVNAATAKSELESLMKEVNGYRSLAMPTAKLIWRAIKDVNTRKIITNPKYAKNFMVGALVATTVMAAAGGFDGNTGSSVQTLLHVTSVVAETVNLTKIVKYGRALPKVNARLANWIGLQKATKVAGSMQAIMAVVQVGVTWGLAIYQLAVSPFSTALLMSVTANAVAQTIVIFLMLAIELIPGIGPIIGAVLALIDAVVAAICFAVDTKRTNDGGVAFSETTAGRRVCGGISGLAAAFIQNFLYSRRALIGNMSSEDRLQFLNAADMFTLVEPGAGIVQGANATVKLDLKNTIQLNTMWKSDKEMDEATLPFPFDPLAIYHLDQYNDTNLKSAVFQYALQAVQTDLHDGLDRDSMSGEWVYESGGSTSRYAILRTVQTTSRDLLALTGVNRPVQLTLAEAQVLPVQECFLIPIFIPVPPFVGIPVCTIVSDDSTNFIPLGEMLTYDVLPPTLDDFLAAAPIVGGVDGYTLAWARGSALEFPRQKDVDGDGLRSKAEGGSDPNDLLVDSDGDGLSDFAELRIGSDPLSSDADQDGLNDREEIIAGTNPRLADTDGDGLTDKQEIDGWEFVYDITTAGQQKSWVTSDPLTIDGDDDDISDALEKTYGFNPRVKSELKVLTYSAQVNEQAAPRLLWRMDGAAGVQAFADESGHSAAGVCPSAAACPETGVAGRYGNAARFDGGDAIQASEPFALENASFSVAFWAKRTAPGANHFAFVTTPTWGNPLRIGFRSSNTFTCDFGGGNATETPAYADTDWHHWACTYDAVTRQRTIYRDGVPATASSGAAPFVGRGYWALGGNSFNGLLDEFAVFDRALSAAEVQKQRDGVVNIEDSIVAPNDVLRYESTVGNELMNRYANGLLTTQMPGSLTSSIAPQTFVLQPREKKTLRGVLTVTTDAASGVVDLTQAAEASIQDRREQSGYAEAWLKFDDAAGSTTFADYSGVQPSRSATCSGAGCPTAGATGAAGGAVVFDGSNDSLSISPGVIVGDFTVAAWVRADDATKTMSVVGSNSAPFGFGMRFDGGNRIGAYIGDGAKWLASGANMTFNYVVGTWYHVAYVVSTSGWTGYVNGVPRGSGAFVGMPVLADASHALRIGQTSAGAEYWKGAVDDLRIYARALTGPDVAELASQPVLNLSFDSGTNARPTDASSVRNTVTCGVQACPTAGGGVVGAGVEPGNDLGYLIASNPALNFNDGNVTLMTWVYPRNTGDATIDAYPQGLIGNNSGDANSMPSLQRVGRKLRFGFGATDGWKEATTSADVLVVSRWNHVAAAFDGTTVNFFVDGVLVESSMVLSGKRPNASDYSLLVGRSDNKWTVNFTTVYVNDEADGAGKAEGTLRINRRDGSYLTHCYTEGWDAGGSYGFCGWGGHEWTPGQAIEMWEEDCGSSSTDDGCDETLIRRSFYGADPNKDYSQYACNNTCVTLNWRVSGQNAIPFKGGLDEMSAYKRALGADQVLAMFEASRLGQVLRLNEPPGSTEYRDATGTYKLTCTDPNCPTAGVVGRLAQGLQFAAGQTLAAPWQGGGEANTVGLWFKTSTAGRTLFTVGGDRQVSLDASGNLVGAYDPGMPSLQKLKDAAQSSPYGAYAASNAIDGNFDTFNHTNIGPQQWWQASLDAGAQRISRVRVYNRFDGSWQRLNPFIVILYRGGSEVWRSGNIAAAVSGNPNPIVVPVPNIVADKVRIQLVNSNYLHVAEVEVETDPLTLSNASQSSTWWWPFGNPPPGYPASNAIDENLSTFGHTVATTGNWWQADIDGVNPLVTGIRLYNRRDANQHKLSPFNVVLYDASGIEVWRKDLVTHDKGNNALVIPVPNIVAKRIRVEHKAMQYLHFAEIRLDTRASAPRSIATSGVNYADGQWHHVMYTMGDAAVGQRLFVDGVERAIGTAPYDGAASRNRGGSIVLGGADASGFDGYMDQVRLFSRGEGLATARKLVADASVIGLKLDEPANSAAFANVAGGANATCTACPTMGGAGKAGSAANFSGTSSIATANAVVPGAFSFGLWVNAREWSPGARLFEKTGSALKLYVENGVMKFSLPTRNAPTVVTMTLPVVNQWQHIVVNYDGAAVQLYLNGSLAKNENINRSLKDTTLNTPFTIGSGYKGLIDEFVMYQRALTAPEIRGDYQYQLGLIAERSTHRIAVDATPPQVILDVADNLYVPNVDRIVSVQAIDTGSAVPFLSFTSQRSGEGAAVQGRSLQCIDASGSGAWCPTFTPRGEGRYTLSAIGRDGVGNSSSPTSKTMFVDATPPQLTVNTPPTLTRPAIRPDGLREVIFSGTVSDPALTNAGSVVAGSGVQTNSVLVELIDPDGNLVEGAAQSALVTGTVWTAHFILAAGQYGNFSIRVRAADRVGNEASVTRGAVLIDVVDPVLSFDANEPGVVSQTTVFGGVVSEIPSDGRAAVYLPFEEETNDIGYVGRARTIVEYDSFAIPYTGTITGTFSVAAWIKPSSVSGAMNYFASRRSDGYSFALGVRDGNTVYGEISDAGVPSGRQQGAVVAPTATPTGNGSGWLTRNASAPFAYTAGTWMHVAFVVSPNSYTIYVNGEKKGSGILSGGTPLLVDAAHQMQLGGTGWDYSNFIGMIDEVAVYRSALSAERVRRLAQPLVAGVPGVEAAFKPVALAASSELVTAGPLAYYPLDDIVGGDNATGFRNLVGGVAAQCSGTQCPTSGARGMRDAAATFDGIDDRLELAGIGSIVNQFTAAAWVRPDSVSRITPIVSESVDKLSAHPFRLQLSGGNQINASIGGLVGSSAVWLAQNVTVTHPYTAGEWVHVAAVVSTTGFALYANGALVGFGAFSGSPLLSDFENVPAIGRGAFGVFDEVRIYTRTLSTAEIYGLYAGRDPVASFDFETGVTDASNWAQPATSSGVVRLPEGQGIAVFDDVDGGISVTPNFQLANRSWSIGAWVKRSSIGTADVIFGAGQPTANNGLSIGFNVDNRFTCSFTNSALTTAAQYTDLDWHYWQCTFDAASRRRTIYRDGAVMATDVAPAAYGGTGAWRIGGTPWSAADAFAGSLDDVQVYPYAFDAREASAAAQSGFRAAQLTPLSVGNAYSAWQITPPAGLEGIYRAELRGVRGGAIAGDVRSAQTWIGMVDTAAPRITVTRSNEIVWLPGPVQAAVYTITVQDMRLNMSKGLRLWPNQSPQTTTTCANGGMQLVGTKQAWIPWAGRLGGAADTVEATHRCTLPATTADSPASSVMITMCDMADNCGTSSTFSSTVAAASRPAEKIGVSAAEPKIELYYPTPQTVFSGTTESYILGYVEAPEGIDSVTILMNGEEIFYDAYTVGPSRMQQTTAVVITEMLDVGIDWDYVLEGENVLVAQVTSGASVASYTTTFLFDETPPSTSFDALADLTFVADRVLTQSMYADPFIVFTGAASDTSDDPSIKQSGIASVMMQLDDATYVASVADGRWSVNVPRTEALPVDGSGPVHQVTLTAIDRAGWNTSRTYSVALDMVAAVITPTWTGANNVSFERPVQDDVMNDYYIGVTRGPTWTFEMLTKRSDPSATWIAGERPMIEFTMDPGPTDPALDGYTSYGHVVIVDARGNVNSYMSPISYTDNARTPDYVSMLETDGPYQGRPYRGWMESGCTLLGTDTRIAERAASGAALKAPQKLYATWSNDQPGRSGDAVRITWSGADWKRDGDLFVYLDTVPDEMPGASYVRHGSNVAYDPYSATMTSTQMLLPVIEYSSGAPSNFPDADRFNADWLLWVEDEENVHLLRWSDANQAWEEQDLPAGSFNYDDSGDELLTEFSLSRELLDTDAMRIVAFATEDGALRTWSVLPASNPATSGRVAANAPATSEPLQTMMTNSYYVQLVDGSCRTPEARTLFNLSAEPGGLVLASKDDEMRLIVPPLTVRPNAFAKIFEGYHDFAGNLESEIGAGHRSWLSGTYCPANPYALACLSMEESVSAVERLSKARDVEYPALLIGQRVTYTVRYVNESSAVKPYSVSLQSEGSSGLGTVQWDAQEWAYGCTGWLGVELPAKFAGELTYSGVVVRPTSRVTVEMGGSAINGAYVQPGCGVAAAMVVDPYAQLAAYYDEDHAGPSYVSIDAPAARIGAGVSLFYGAVVDKSPVPTVTLEYVVGAGGTNSVVCGGDTEPSDGVWACVIDVGAAADGTDVKVRVKATDAFGNEGAFSAWENYKVDAAEPVLTPQSQTQTGSGSGGLTIGGVVSDDGGITGIEVCNRTTGVCTNITIVFTASEVQRTKFVIEAADVAPQPLGRGLEVMSAPTAASMCGVGSTGVVRSFVVSDTFKVADVTVNLNVEHAKRSDLLVKLASPRGTTASLIAFTTTVRAANFDVVLTDAAAVGVVEDRAAQDVGAPSYENERRPVEALSVFDGEEAVGEWLLAVCDMQADADSGVLNSAQLQLQAEVTATSTTGTWTYDVAAEGDVDGEERVFEFYAVDASGNRSSEPTLVTVTLDNVAPVLTATQMAALLDMSETTPTVVLSGTVSDGGGVQSVQVRVEGPSGATTYESVRVAAGSAPLGAARTTTEWEYEFVPSEVGRHKVTLTAADVKENTTTSMEYEVYAEEPVAGLGVSVDANAALVDELRQFAAATTGGSNVAYTWDFGDGVIETTAGGEARHSYSAAGTYNAVVTASNALGALSAGVMVTVSEELVEPTPTPEPSGPTPMPPGDAPTPEPGGPTPTPGALRAVAYLPLVMRDAKPSGDLSLVSMQIDPKGGIVAISPVEIVVVLRNEGQVSVEGFWVDLYIDPVRAPVVNEQWSMLCEPAWPNANCYGGAWRVAQAIAPGETMTLTSQALIGDAAYSHWTGSFMKEGEHRVYALIDSYAADGNPQGAVREEDETNNSASLTVTVDVGMMVQLEATPEGAPVEELGPLQVR